jgi:hypothetical protein
MAGKRRKAAAAPGDDSGKVGRKQTFSKEKQFVVDSAFGQYKDIRADRSLNSGQRNQKTQVLNAKVVEDIIDEFGFSPATFPSKREIKHTTDEELQKRGFKRTIPVDATPPVLDNMEKMLIEAKYVKPTTGTQEEKKQHKREWRHQLLATINFGGDDSILTKYQKQAVRETLHEVRHPPIPCACSQPTHPLSIASEPYIS